MKDNLVDWEERYSIGDTPWNKGAAAPCIAEGLAGIAVSEGAEVLVPGCGFGHDVLALSQHGLQVTGVDISQTAINGARILLEDKKNITLQHGDLFDLSQPWKNRFDLIWEHTCYCAIDPSARSSYMAAIADMLTDKGILLGVFFIDTQMPPGEGPPYETSVEELHQSFSPHFDLLWEKSPELSYSGREGREWLVALEKRAR